MKIPLGTIVRCRVTGFTGVAENRATFMYGCDRYCVQPQVDKDGKLPDSIMVDEPQLEIVEGESKVMDAMAEPPELVKLGQWVEDPVRGLEGTVTGRGVYLNGCARVWVSPKQTPANKVESWWVDEEQVIVKKDFVNKQEGATIPDNKQKPGGPAPCSSKY